MAGRLWSERRIGKREKSLRDQLNSWLNDVDDFDDDNRCVYFYLHSLLLVGSVIAFVAGAYCIIFTGKMYVCAYFYRKSSHLTTTLKYQNRPLEIQASLNTYLVLLFAVSFSFPAIERGRYHFVWCTMHDRLAKMLCKIRQFITHLRGVENLST